MRSSIADAGGYDKVALREMIEDVVEGLKSAMEFEDVKELRPTEKGGAR